MLVSQPSFGLSMHACPAGQGMPAMPPQDGPVLTGQAPCDAMLAPALAATQALLYVFPSQLHTGLKTNEHTCGFV